MPMDPELERWKAAGRSFDYLGFDVFYRTGASAVAIKTFVQHYRACRWTNVLINGGGEARTRLTMTLAAPKRRDHDVNFMIAAEGGRFRRR